MAAERTSPTDSAPGASSDPRRPRILVVDDSPTILALIETVLVAEGYVVVAARSGEAALAALEREAPFSLALVDFAMSGMSGYELCRSIRRERRHARLAIVLMSARASALRELFIDELGALGAVAKPFEPRALVEAVSHALEAASAVPPGRPSAPTATDLVDEERAAHGSEAPPPQRREEAVAAFARDLATAVGPHLAILRHTDLPPARVVEDALLVGLEDERLLTKLASALDSLELPLESGALLRCDLAHLPLAEVLQLLELRRQSGVLSVASGPRRLRLALENGRLELAFARGLGPSFRLGRYLSRLELLTRDEVEDAVAECRGRSPLGEWFIRAGKLDLQGLHRALATQSTELVYEALRWTHGRCAVTLEPPWPEALRAHLGLGVNELVLEGFRRVDEWRVLDEALDRDRRVVMDARALEAVQARLGPFEREAVVLANGARSLRQLVEASDQAAFDVTAAVYRLVRARVARLV